MTRSIFDPTGPNTEHGGNRYSGENADNHSHMPESAVDGKVGPRPPTNDTVEFDADGKPVTPDPILTEPVGTGSDSTDDIMTDDVPADSA